jgi:hypothetical protein
VEYAKNSRNPRFLPNVTVRGDIFPPVPQPTFRFLGEIGEAVTDGPLRKGQESFPRLNGSIPSNFYR